MSKAWSGDTVRLRAYPDVTGTVFDTGTIEGDAVAYVHLSGSGNAALTDDRFDVVNREEI